MQTLDGIYIVEIEDRFVRENFKKLKDYAAGQYLLKSLKFFEISIVGNKTNLKFPHNLGFKPKDIVQTSVIGAGTWTWNYSLFDKNNLDITTSGTSGTITVRALIGNLEEV